ncbi:MAG TPA: penicillin-binding protein 1C [Candidatus Methylomirabilis sp.]|nr:penicillin-binding protein 1C [Candidatus Methylomirabilis sp.]
MLLASAVFFILWSVTPVLSDKKPVASTKVFARDGSLLYEISRPGEGLRTPVSVDRMPITLVRAVIAAEDARFRSHAGVDAIAIVRAMKDLAIRGRVSGGASTIEQQVVKNLYFRTSRRTVFLKAREAVAAVFWSMRHTKDETLETYLNTVPFGNQANGVQAAARTYFRKDIADLTLAESAMLAGVIAAPSAYDPYAHRSAANTRQRYVLDRMLEDGTITKEERNNADKTDVIVFVPTHPIKAPHFVFHVLDELEQRILDIRTGGYEITTTLDPELQSVAEGAVARRLESLMDQRVTSAAVVAINPIQGDVLAYVGSADYFNDAAQGSMDMATAKRQPGSALKPFMYFTAFMKGVTPGTVIADLPVRFETVDGKPYYPRNYNYRIYGPVTARDALASSLNIPAVKVLSGIGLQTFFGSLARFGLTFPEPADHYGLGIVLGGGEVTLADTTRAYGVLAQYGRSAAMRDVLEVRDGSGRAVLRPADERLQNVFEEAKQAEQASALVADILRDRLARSRSFGEANLLETGKNVAVKTGTTRDFRDNWAFGYAPDFVVGVWVGNADGTPMQGVSGITGAVPIWRDIVDARFRARDAVRWPVPHGIVEREICVTSGLLANDICPKTRVEKFIEGTEPVRQDDWYVRMDVDGRTGLLATNACRDLVSQYTFLVPPPEYVVWLAASKAETPPSTDCEGRKLARLSVPLTILSPLDGDVYERDEVVDPAAQRIPFIAGGESRDRYRWVLNNRPIESDDATILWDPVPGIYELQLEGSNRQVRFTVR